MDDLLCRRSETTFCGGEVGQPPVAAEWDSFLWRQSGTTLYGGGGVTFCGSTAEEHTGNGWPFAIFFTQKEAA